MNVKINSCRFISRALIILTLPFAHYTFAACAATPATTPAIINFGTVASQNVPVGGLTSNGAGVAASFDVSCSVGLTLQLLSTTSWLRYTPQNALTLTNGTDTIGYTMSSDSSFTTAITAAGQSIGGSVGFNLLTLAILTSGNFTIPLYIKTTTTTIWPNAGTYTGSQNLTVDGSICTGVGLPGVCLGSSPVSSSVTFTLKLIVSKSCEFISTPSTLSFTTVSFLENASAIQLNATMRCTHLEDYLFYADNGNHYSSNTRRMTSPANNSIAYQIMQPSSSTIPLSSISSLSRLGTGASETLTLPIKITPGQATPPAAIYTDSVRMVIEY